MARTRIWQRLAVGLAGRARADGPARGENGASGRLNILAFEVAGHDYGVPLADVERLWRAVAVVPLPKAPAIIEGVINVQGNVVPVFDIRTRFRLPAKSPQPSDHLVVARAGSRRVALRVDRVQDVIAVDGDNIEDPADSVPHSEYVSGIAKLPEGLLLIHDLMAFLSEAEGAALDAALASAEGDPCGSGGTP